MKRFLFSMLLLIPWLFIAPASALTFDVGYQVDYGNVTVIDIGLNEPADIMSSTSTRLFKTQLNHPDRMRSLYCDNSAYTSLHGGDGKTDLRRAVIPPDRW